MNSFDDISSSRSCLNQDMGPDSESSFLEKYFYDLITDNCEKLLTNTIYRTLIDQIKDKKQLDQIISNYIQDQLELYKRQKIHYKYFFAKQDISMKKLTNQFKSLLLYDDTLSHTNSTLSSSSNLNKNGLVTKSDFCEIYENQFLFENYTINKGELIYIDTKFRISNQQLKLELEKIRQHLMKQLLYATNQQDNFIETFGEYYNLNSITILFFYNGDVNFDFDKYFDLKEVYIAKKKYNIKIKVFYISACKIQSNFCNINNIHLNIIQQQHMAFYELKRYGQNKIIICKTIQELQKLKEKINYSYFTDYKFYLILSILAIGSYSFFKTFNQKIKSK